MATYIALLRGINVGGHNVLPMQSLRDIFTARGCGDVQTVIQSGNVVFSFGGDSDVLGSDVAAAIEKQFSFRPGLLILSSEDYAEVVAANPLFDTASDPRFLHVWFLTSLPANADLAAVESRRGKTEIYALKGAAFFLYAPDGVGRSKLASSVEKCLAVEATARNWRTVSKILELASKLDAT